MNLMYKNSTPDIPPFFPHGLADVIDVPMPPLGDIPELTERIAYEPPPLMESAHLLPAVAEAAVPPVITRTPVRIVGGRSGTTMLRLLSERADNVHVKYILESVTVAPYSVQQRELMSVKNSDKGGNPIPMTVKEANRAFDREAARKYPPVKHPRGMSLETSICLL